MPPKPRKPPAKIKVAKSDKPETTIHTIAAKEKKAAPSMSQQLVNTRDRHHPSPSVQFLDNPQDFGVIADAKDPFIKKMRKRPVPGDVGEKH